MDLSMLTDLSQETRDYCKENSVTIEDWSRSLPAEGFSYLLLFDKNQNSFPIGFLIWKSLYQTELKSGELYQICNDPKMENRWSILPYYVGFLYSKDDAYYRVDGSCPIEGISEKFLTDSMVDTLIQYVSSISSEYTMDYSKETPMDTWNKISIWFR